MAVLPSRSPPPSFAPSIANSLPCLLYSPTVEVWIIGCVSVCRHLQVPSDS
ncbi:hypothetical protein BRADI_3g22689v3 [Brachypodium distachyon]|uniref:Uncharacterized protein n=1 Tax=Brachypodium distachyon TaxID=15368 RepID=A0A2K2CYW5_BRADI|nr:hypothetical protein BRADI_3g22689v3 [Brachypodium distachyon]